MAEQENTPIPELLKAKRWLVKFGSAIVTNEGVGMDHRLILAWCQKIAKHKRSRGIEPIFVSSGAIAEGMARLGLEQRPSLLIKLQAIAAIGQSGVMQAYQNALDEEGFQSASLLLTRQDLSNRQGYLNARSTLNALIDMGVIPVINENDTTATEEIRFGDNDFLAALVANLIEADVLVLLTDQKGLHKKDPRIDPNSELIRRSEASNLALDQYAGTGGAIGRGGMKSKLAAARQAGLGGTFTVVCDGRDPSILDRLLSGYGQGTLLTPGINKLTARKRWLSAQPSCQGSLILDAGAVKVLQGTGSSLLPVGVLKTEGRFERGALVSCKDASGTEIAKGLSNYSSDEAQLILGCKSSELKGKLGYGGESEIVHRDNMIINP